MKYENYSSNKARAKGSFLRSVDLVWQILKFLKQKKINFGLTLLFVVMLSMNVSYAGLPGWKEATPSSPSAIATQQAKVELSVTPTPTNSLKHVPHHLKVKNGTVNAEVSLSDKAETFFKQHPRIEKGLSSAEVPEKYKRTEMFTIPSELSGKYGDASKPVCRVDDQENIYMTFQHAVVVFDKSGKIIKEIPKDNEQQNALLVDEQGDVCIYSDYGPSISWVYDSNGNLMGRPDFRKWNFYKDGVLRFSNGVIYAVKTGKIFYRLPSADENKIDQKIFLENLKYQLTDNRATQYEMDENGNWLPRRIDGFDFEYVMNIDSFGDIYAVYELVPLAGEHPVWVLYRLYKFNSKFRLLTKFDFYPNDINLKTGTIYQLEGIGFGRLVKWEKPVEGKR